MDFDDPSGGVLQNYVVIDTNRKVFYDVGEDIKRCLACMSRKDTTYTLRGKCEDSLLGTVFSFTLEFQVLLSEIFRYHIICINVRRISNIQDFKYGN